MVTLGAAESLGACPSCHGRHFARASLFAAGRFTQERPRHGDAAALLTAARAVLPGPGRFLAFELDGEVRLAALGEGHTRVGRSLSAEVRFDDATVSRRHAIIVADGDGVRILDDRSLNGVFVNGKRVELQALADGDEIVIGRHRMCFVESAAAPLSDRPSQGLSAA